MRVIRRFTNRRLAALAAVLALGCAATARAQNPDTLSPEESAARAKKLIQQAIQALGGPAYLGVKDITRTGRFAQFGHSGELTGYIRFWDFTKLPDKSRTEFSKKRNIITVDTATQGWELDRGGVQEAPADEIAHYNESMKKDVDVLLRDRLNEPGLSFRWGGTDTLDLKQVDWVEIVDAERRTMRIALDRQTHLPVRAVYLTRDPVTRERTEEVEYFANYHTFQGVETPLQVTRERNGLKVFQVFFDECQYNTGLTDSLFTRESLEQRFAQLNKGKKPK